MNNVVIMVPTYNEAENIELLIDGLEKFVPEAKILIVDDNSPDGTCKIVEKLQQKYKNLFLLLRTEKKGRGYAGIDGFKKCLEMGADVIVEMDADLSHSPSEINKMISELETSDVDIVVGSRYVSEGKDTERNFIRRTISILARIYLRVITGIPLKDITSGFKVYKRKVIETILPKLSASDPFIVTEVNYLCKLNNFKFKEVPIEFHQRYKGKSKLTASKLFIYLLKVLSLVVKSYFSDIYNLRFVQFLSLITVLRLFLIPLFGLTDDESHYWQYSQYLDFSYYDHPPMVGWGIYFFSKIFGNNIYAIRLLGVSCFTIATIYFFSLVKIIFNSEVAFFSSILLNVVPIFFVGSIVTIPDAPLGMFWMMYMFYFYKFCLTKRQWYLYLSGLLLGFAFLSKYNAVLLLFSSVVIMFLDKKLRGFLLKKEFVLFLFTILIVSSPVILWNMVHKFVSFNYQFHHGMGNKINISLQTFVQNISSQAAYLGVFTFIFLWYYVFKIIFNKKSFGENFLLWFSIPGIIGFNLIGLSNQILPHWPAVSYISILPSLYKWFKTRWQYYISIVFSVIITAFVLIVTIFGLIKIPANLENADTPDKLYGWDVAARELHNFISSRPDVFILTHKHYVAGQLRFALSKFYSSKKIPEVFCVNDYLDQYDFWKKNLTLLENKDIVFITEKRFPASEILPLYSVSEYKLISVIKYKKSIYWPVRSFEFYLLKNFSYKKLPSQLKQDNYNNNIEVIHYLRELDKKLFLKLNKNRFAYKKFYRYIFFILTSLGSGYVILPLMVFVLYFVDKKNFLYNIIIFIFIAGSGGMLVQLLKWLFDKPRPLKLFADMLNVPIVIIGEQLREFGFPSGHTFVAFCSGVYLSERIKKWYVTLLLFVIAVLVGISRVCVGAHFVSDVIAGTVIGIGYTYFFLKIEEEIKTL